MNYRELQIALRPYREKGLTDIMLNAPKPMLEAELERLQSVISHQSSVTSEEKSEVMEVDEAIAFCPTCEGEPVFRCPRCNSRGLVEDPEAAPMTTTYECPRCDSRGFIKKSETENPQWLSQSICPDCRRDEFSGDSSDPSNETVLELVEGIAKKVFGADVEVSFMQGASSLHYESSSLHYESSSDHSDSEPSTSDPLNKPFPCWLSSKQTAQAKALEELEFYYIGTVDDWEEPWPELLLSRYKDWAFYTAYLSPGFLEAHCKGAIFNAYIDEDASKQEYKDLIKKAKAVLKEIDKNWGEQFGTQLDIFTALKQANAPPQCA